MRVKLFIDFDLPIEKQYTTILANHGDNVTLRWPLVKDPNNNTVFASLATVLSVLPLPATSVQFSSNWMYPFINAQSLREAFTSLDGTYVSSVDLRDLGLHILSVRSLTNGLATALSGLPHSVASVGLSNNSLHNFGIQDLRNALIVLNDAGVSSVDLSWNYLHTLGAQGLREIFTDLSAITTLNLSGNQLRRGLGVEGLTLVLAAISAHSVTLSDDDLNLSDEELTHLFKEISPTVNEIICVPPDGQQSVNQEKVNRVFNQIRQHTVNRIEESIPDLATELSSLVMQYATHGFWRPAPKMTTNDNILTEANLDTMTLR